MNLSDYQQVQIAAERSTVMTVYTPDLRPEDILKAFGAYLLSKRRSDATVRQYLSLTRRMLDAFPNPFLVTPIELERYMAFTTGRLKPSTVNGMITAARAFYRWAERFGYMTENPTKWMENVRRNDEMAAKADDADILAGLVNSTPEQRAILLLARTLGLRRSEIATLRIEDRQGDWLHVTGKGNRTRVLRIQPELAAALTELENGESDWYFPGRWGGHRTPESVYVIIRKLVHINPHALRHAAATAVYEGTGKDIRATQIFLGHAQLQTTQRYVHVNEADMIKASIAARLTEGV